jgi:phenylacetate-CoA ligase
MIKYKGTTLYPSALYNVLDAIRGLSDYLIEVSRNEIGTDEILIKAFSCNPSEELAKEIKDHVKAKLRVTPTIEMAASELNGKSQLNSSSRKHVKFIDKRVNE